MRDVDVRGLDVVVTDLHRRLGDGLLATDIWDRRTGWQLASHNTQPEAVALLNQLTEQIDRTLAGGGHPTLGDYLILDLDDDHVVVLMIHGELVHALILDAAAIDLEVLYGVALPLAMSAVAEAATRGVGPGASAQDS